MNKFWLRIKVRRKPTTCVRNRKDLKPKWIEQLKTQFRAFVDVNTEANRSMLPSLKTKSRDNNNRLYIEKQFTALLKKFTTSSGRTLRSFVQSFRMLLGSHNYKYSDVNLAHVLTTVRVRSKPSTCVQNRKDSKPRLIEQ